MILSLVSESLVKQMPELDYFIRTDKSIYFETIFWSIPVAYPGSSRDLIDVYFILSDKGYSYYFEFNQI